jgi:anti-sigma factor RsiW
MQHLDEGTIHSWLDGALSADEAARVAAHVAECPQCAAAVAEARGFIAASSRILTALDHVPRGVVPTAQPVKWYNRAAWRAAAAVLVVAVGSLVVVRNGGNTAPESSFTFVEEPDTAPIPKPAPPIVIAASPRTTVTRKPQAPAAVAPSTQSATASGVKPSSKPTAEADFSAARSRVSGGATAPEPALSSRVPGVTMMDAAAEQPALKVVGTPKTLGEKVTLYEVAPGDTVTLTEVLSVHLEGIVTGASPTQPRAVQLRGKSSAAPQAASQAASQAAPQAAPQAASQAALPAAAPPLQVAVVNGVTTISWPDAATGNMLKLSGRMPVEWLKEVKLRIELERAAAAAKKSP